VTAMKELLADVAAEARPYDVTDLALRTARRQRRIAWAVPVVAVVLVAAGVVAVLPLRQDKSATVSWLPATLAPAGSVRDLPAGPVGPAALAYTRDDGSTTLVTEDGQHYRAGEAVRSISPDGSWVAMRRDGRLVLRDLTGSGTVEPGYDDDTAVVAWSSDSRWAAVRTGPADPGTDQNVTMFDLETGRPIGSVPAGRHGSTTVCGLRDSTNLMLCHAVDSSAEIVVSVIDTGTGRDVGGDTVTMDGTTARLFAGGQLMSDGHTLALWTENYRPDEGTVAPGDPLTFDLDRPASQARSRAVPVPGGGLRHVESSVDGDLIVTRRVPAGQAQHVAAVELFDLGTGRLATVTTVTGDIRDIIVRGQV